MEVKLRVDGQGKLNAFIRTLQPGSRAHLHTVGANALSDHVRRHLRSVAPSRHATADRLGGKRTMHIKNAIGSVVPPRRRRARRGCHSNSRHRTSLPRHHNHSEDQKVPHNPDQQVLLRKDGLATSVSRVEVLCQKVEKGRWFRRRRNPLREETERRDNSALQNDKESCFEKRPVALADPGRGIEDRRQVNRQRIQEDHPKCTLRNSFASALSTS